MKFENETFKDAQITLDYNEFVNCSFTNCVFHFAGGSYILNGCSTKNVRLNFHDAALRTLEYLKMVYACPNGPQIVHEHLTDQQKAARVTLN